VHPLYTGPGEITFETEDGVTENFWGWRTKVMNTPRGMEEQFCDFKLRNAESIEELEKYR
jgi:hypothetical protein